jgi:hypothetical protein
MVLVHLGVTVPEVVIGKMHTLQLQHLLSKLARLATGSAKHRMKIHYLHNNPMHAMLPPHLIAGW